MSLKAQEKGALTFQRAARLEPNEPSAILATWQGLADALMIARQALERQARASQQSSRSAL